MKKTLKIIKKILLITIVSLEIILINIQPSQAFLDKVLSGGLSSLAGGILGQSGSATPNANGMLEQMEQRYHLNTDSIKDFGESFNVSNQKSPAPEVDVLFDLASPKLGEKITATAMPKYFQESKENMYFNWYVKHDGCDESDSITAENEKCDVDGIPSINSDGTVKYNGDGKVTSNDWKVEAMRLIAGNGFITSKADYNSKSTDAIKEDGFDAPKGGRVNVQKKDYYYIHDFETGKDYELAEAKKDGNDDEDKFLCDDGDGDDDELADDGDANHTEFNDDGTVICGSPYTLSCGILEGTTAVPSTTATNEGSSTSNDSTSSGNTTTTDNGDGTSSSSTTTTNEGGTTTTSTTTTTSGYTETFGGSDISATSAVTDSGYAPTCNPETKKATCPQGTVARCLSDEDLELIDPSCEDVGEGGGDGLSPNYDLEDVSVNNPPGADVHPYQSLCYHDGRSFNRFSDEGQKYCGGVGSTCIVTLNLPDGRTYTQSFPNPDYPQIIPGKAGCEEGASNRGCGGRYELPDGFLWKSKGDNAPHNLALFFPAEFSPGCDITDPGEKDPSCESTLYRSEGSITATPKIGKNGIIPKANDKVELISNHLFPGVGESIKKGSEIVDIGDGKFTLDEEMFWGTNPADPSTANNGNTDEQNVAGLGTDKLTWQYLPGDEVGLIAEGQSYLPTKHDDSSNAITFALPKNIFNSTDKDSKCKIEEADKGEDTETKGVYTELIKGFDVSIPFAKLDINECLKENLVAPTDGNQADNMDLTMDYAPKNPNVGSSGGVGGDNLIVTTSTSDKKLDNTQIYYKWSIYGSTQDKSDLSLDKNDWGSRIDDANFRTANNITKLEGLGMDQFEMQLNDIGNYNFLRFFVESEEFFDTGNGSENTTRSGRGDIIVEPNVSTSGSIIFNAGNTETTICTDGDICEVLEKQLITAKLNAGDVNNYLWTLDGKEIATMDSGETKQGNEIKFVLDGNAGDYHTLNVIANDTAGPKEGGNNGQKLNITRNFMVTKPMVAIGPNNRLNRVDETECKDLNGNIIEGLGTYQVVDDPNIPESEKVTITLNDCKEKVTSGNGIVTITPTYSPEFINNAPTDFIRDNFDYTINGETITHSNECTAEKCAIDLRPYAEGSAVNISFEAQYIQTNEERFTLKSWGFSEGATSGTKISDSISVKITTPVQAGVIKLPKIIAGLAYNLPEQMIFLFRMLLTAGVIIFTAGLVLRLGKKYA